MGPLMKRETWTDAFTIAAVYLITYFYSALSFAQTNPVNPNAPVTPGTNQVINVSGLSAQSMLISIATQVPNLMRMVTAIAYVAGMVLIIYGIIKLKHLGESRTMMSREHHVGGPLIEIICGVALLYIPSAVQVGMSTFWTNPNPGGYTIPTDPYGDFLKVVYLIVQFIGTIAFIRGIFILSKLGGQGGQQGALSKGILHIIGGIFCINIYQFVQVIMYTLGLGLQT